MGRNAPVVDEGGTRPMAQPDPPSAPRTDRSPWNWLLLIPIVVPLLVVLFNGKEPTLFGFPRFYWLQLAFIILGVGTTTLVYQLTKKTGR
jgi:hypothetical protein